MKSEPVTRSKTLNNFHKVLGAGALQSQALQEKQGYIHDECLKSINIVQVQGR